MKTAIVLFNLGGPDRLESVQPFLFNLFNDPAIMRVPSFLRGFIARRISTKREKFAQDIYRKIGGHSPILRNTQLQAAALEQAMQKDTTETFKCFVAMRYWHPFVEETILDVKDFAPDRVVLLPLYPQFSTTTTQSSLDSWHKAAKDCGLNVPTKTICCYPTESGFVQAMAERTRDAYTQAQQHGKPRILFSAHGLPEKIIRAGDPYQWQCEQTASVLRNVLNISDLDWTMCYQSRVGPLKWIGPSTDDEIRRAGKDKVPIVIVPIAFVSEHSETLVEIDMEYRHLASESGVPFFAYTGTVGTTPRFIQGLADLVQKSLMATRDCVSVKGQRLCPPAMRGCCQNK